MKKKIIKIVSSILGVFAICGLSLFSVLDYKKDTEIVSAYAVNDLYHTNWTFPTDTDNSTNNTNFHNTWNLFHSLMRPSENYPLKPTRENISWSYNFDYDVTGYIQTDYFERIRLQFGYSWSEVLWETETFYVHIFADTINNFELSSVGSYGLWSRWSYFSESYAPDHINNYSTTYETDRISFIDGTDRSNNYLIFFLNTLCSFSGGNDYTDENIQISQYESTIQELTEQVLSLEAQLNQAKSESYSEGYNVGLGVGYDNGYSIGYNEGVDSQEQVIQSAYTSGYNEGYNAADSADATVATIFSNILLIGMLPVDFFLRILNWEFLGINMASFVSALMSVAATIIVIRIVTGKKND